MITFSLQFVQVEKTNIILLKCTCIIGLFDISWIKNSHRFIPTDPWQQTVPAWSSCVVSVVSLLCFVMTERTVVQQRSWFYPYIASQNESWKNMPYKESKRDSLIKKQFLTQLLRTASKIFHKPVNNRVISTLEMA